MNCPDLCILGDLSSCLLNDENVETKMCIQQILYYDPLWQRFPHSPLQMNSRTPLVVLQMCSV